MDRSRSGKLDLRRSFRRAALALSLCTVASGSDPAAAGPPSAPARGVTVRVEGATGAPVAGAFVRAEAVGASRPEDLSDVALAVASETDARGIARLTGLRPRVVYTLEVTSENLPESVRRMLPEGAQRRGRFEAVTREKWTPKDDVVRVVLNPKVLLRAVDDRDGKTPVPGAAFDAENGHSGSHGVGVANAAGECELFMLPGETLRLQATAMGSKVRFDPGAWTEVTSESKEVVFAIDTRPRRIRVHLENRSKADLVWEAKGPGVRNLGGRASASVADVDVPGLTPEEAYEIRFWEDGPDGGAATVKDAKPSETRVTLKLLKTEVRGRVVGATDLAGAKADAAPAEPASPFASRSVSIASDGSFVLRLPPGTWKIGALAKGKSGWLRVAKEVEVVDTPIELELVFE